MKVQNLLPAKKISEYVDRILVIENNRVIQPFMLPLYANGVPNLLFKSVKGKLGNNNANYLTLFGQTVLPETLTLPENFTLIAYFFKPFTIISLFGIAAQELTDKPIDLDLLYPQQTFTLQERLLNAHTVEDMLAVLDDFIFKLISKSKTECSLVKYATNKIANTPSKESLVLVQKDLHVTERTFQRMFEKNIGIAPGLYRRICQFNTAFVQLNTRNFQKLTDIAFHNGYADQSHYIRTFKEFTNITPKDYLKFGTVS